MNQRTLGRRRALGSYYTPEWIARWMVERSLADANRLGESHPLRVLDPACGDGAFVLSALKCLAGRNGTHSKDARGRLSLVREHVFGVDADPTAIQSLRQRVAEWIGLDAIRSRDIEDVLMTNFLCGDALVGRGWSDPSAEYSLSTQHSNGIDWPVAFPPVAAAGGFDLVIGNPPYRRELNAKDAFDRIAASPLGQKWRRARMDLWHYFLHRGLDLLKPGGTLCYIVNSYWTRSTAAQPLVERLASETVLEEIVLFGTAKLFRGVSGRHMIFRVRKGHETDRLGRVVDLSNVAPEQIEAELAADSSLLSVNDDRDDPRVRLIPQRDLFNGGRLRIEATDPGQEHGLRGVTLDEMFEVRQGLAENPPFVTKTIAEELGNPALFGRGVFVLTQEEVESLRLTERERALLRPYYSLSTIGRFRVARQPSYQVLYLTRHTAPALDDLPHVAAHLEPFRTALERRREVRLGAIQWWHLHWPREERLFTAPRVLCVQMGHAPRFAYADHPTFVGFSLHVILARAERPAGYTPANSTPSLAALTAILNSSRARRWFEAHAKRRGANLDISGSVLKQFPLPRRLLTEIDSRLEQLAREWPGDQSGMPNEVEAELDRLVERCYGIE